ncbi:MAG: FHA domain-containing protein [Bacteroidaceae bacterium]|nr:FHA domain-containing protein [Bacteroidaceae bacterium]
MIKCPKCQAEIEDDSFFCDQCGAELFVCPKCSTLGKGKRCTRCGEPLVSVRTLGSNHQAMAGPVAAAAKSAAGSASSQPSSTPSSPPQPSSASRPSSAPAGGSITTDIDKVLGSLDLGALSGGGLSAGAAPSSSAPSSSAPSLSASSLSASSSASPSSVAPSPASGASATIRPGAAPQPAAQRQVPGHLVCRNPQLRLYIDDVIIGRREGGYASVFAAFGMVSGRHAQISRSSSGGWQVMDLGSTNGTRLNGQPLLPNNPVAFWVGDTISFADIDFEAVP